MTSSHSRRWLHRLAWLTATMTLLLPVTTGAVVTTLKAGMVFSDWPSSDGHNMLTYPWLSSARDQFVEHGHRLSGLVVGLLSMTLAISAWFLDGRGWVRVLATAIALAVFMQGMLGGARVLLDRDTLALLHGDFAACVFSLMAVMVLVTGTEWESMRPEESSRFAQSALAWSIASVVAIGTQYVLGGILRHLKLGWAWNLHPWFASVPGVTVMGFAIVASASEVELLKRCALALVGLVGAQIVLGLATWAVRYGVPSWGIVATHESVGQVAVCSLHKVVGMLAFMTSIVSVVCGFAVQPGCQSRDESGSSVPQRTVMGGVS